MDASGIVAQQALTRIALATEAVKSNAQAQKNVANMIDSVARNVPAAAGRGAIVDVLA